jgi:glutathione S-transferase
MVKLELVYFPIRARNEVICMCLRFGAVPYTCKSVSEWYGQGWGPGVKEKTPWGQVPILFVDGEPLAQSGSIVRYAASLSGLTPTDAFEAAKCDSVFEATQEVCGELNRCVNVYKGDQFAEKKAAVAGLMPVLLGRLSTHLKEGPFFLGHTPFYCDLSVYHILSHVELLDAALLEPHANLKAHMAAVAGLQGVKDYLAERPDCVDIGTKPSLKPKQ